jgi:hypothetical protein
MLEKVEEIRDQIKASWKSLDEQITSNTCLVEHYAKIKN